MNMSHTTNVSHIDYPVRLGDRGRLVLPAEVRRAMDVTTGDELVARLDGDSVHIVSRRQLARQARGSLAPTGRDLVDELLAERRAEAE